ncbi:amidase [Bacterioplanes sanyensis]|uniref:Amidase n=1 Tax=Bacterioplanes sanyensis TaxID=1249553 RepID=A0A222FK59_9GAMM|nr:amidase [Bacterioplanes sanyensis]ASP39415.1 amidase [Bacterioplanes sanyensis]
MSISESPTRTSLASEYQQQDALGLAELVRRGDVSANELLEHAIKLAERLNPAINAIITPLYDHARAQIAQGLPQGPFTGVPFLMKDLISELAGTPISSGSNALRQYTSSNDSELTRRYKNTGVVIFGKTNTPEFGLMGVTEPKAFGPARNPWNTEHTPGGSSGGSAAAIAAGIVPMASGGDGGGSIRIPAACCGLFGLKPSRGRTPTGPYYSELWDGAAVEHVLTRSVRDSAAMLDAIAGPDSASPYPLEVRNDFLATSQQTVRPLKIGVSTRSFVGRPVAAEAVKAVEHSVELLQQLGHQVDEVDLQLDGEALADAYLTMYFGHVAADLDYVAQLLSSRPSNLDVELTTRTIGMLGKRISAGEFVSAKRRWNQFAQSMALFHQRYDLLLTPTLGDEPVALGAFEPPLLERIGMHIINGLGLHTLLLKSGMVKAMAMDNLEKLPFTQLANLTGAPAMSVPLYWTANGLPLGVQFMAPMGDEGTLLQLATQLEQAQPWLQRRPQLQEHQHG